MESDRGRRLLPTTLDYLADTNPGRVYAAIPKSSNLDDGFRDVTVAEVSQAVHALAHWISKNHGRSTSFETLAYVGLNDLRYPVFWFAAIKCGYKVLFLSPRNTVPQNLSLLEQTACRKLFYTPELEPLLQPLRKAAGPVEGFSIAPFDEWLASFTEPFPFSKSFEEAKDDPVIVLHSSGSTGNPKPITNSHAFFTATDVPLPEVEGRTVGGISLLDYDGGGFIYSPFPGYHMAGITALSYFPVFMRSASIILGPPDKFPTLDMVNTILKSRYVRVLYLPPTIIEALSQIPSALELMKKAESVIFAGGPLSQPVGDMLSNHVTLSSSYGSTEMANVACLLPEEREDWSWLCWHPAHHVVMEPSVDGAYELVLNQNPEADPYRAISQTILRKQDQFRSRDLFKRHPTKPDLWQFYGRNDDIIVFSNGEKWNPVPSEGIIQSHAKLSGVLVLGDGRFEAAALLEPKEAPESDAALLEEIWPTVQKANDQSQRFGQISRTKLAIVPPGSLLRAPKGTVVRKLTAEKFQDVINRLYSDDDGLANGSVSTPLLDSKTIRQKGLLTALQALVSDSVKLSLPSISEDDDFYAFGMDSLQTLELVRTLKRALTSEYSLDVLSFLSTQLVFANPSVTRLASAIYYGLRGESETLKSENIDDLVSRMSGQFPSKPKPLSKVGYHVLLTGSTGSLGQSLLLALCWQNSVSRITCLNRDASAASKAASILSSVPDDRKPVIDFLTTRLEEPGFGLSWEDLRSLDDAHIIVHSAWKVDFNQTLPSFEPLVKGTINLARWGASKSRPAHMNFVSSVASTAGYSSGLVPEDFIFDSSAADVTGYGQSKQASERLLAQLSEQTAMPITVLRIGQIAGTIESATGAPSWSCSVPQGWNPNEWVPLLVCTSKALNLLPLDLPVAVDWIPMNIVAESVAQIATESPQRSSSAVYNIVNPKNRTWSSLAPVIQPILGSECSAVPYTQWLSALQEKQASRTDVADAVARYPALKIIGFFERLAKVDDADEKQKGFVTDGARKMSPALDRVDMVQDSWVESWVKEWV